MNDLRKPLLLVLVFLCAEQSLFSQYILNGSAQQNACNCYTLTQTVTNQSGSVWNANKISLATSFDFWFNVYLGCNDAGADGIVFILQPVSTRVGTTGQGMGFGGVLPSVGIALDTYQNTALGDPAFDHISIQANGNVDHAADLAGPIAVSATSENVEDCQWHKLRISWDASTKWLRTYFDGVLRVEKQADLVATVFNNNPLVFWGFTGATGGAVNLQQFCTALDPVFTTNVANNVVCEGMPVQFTNASESFAPIASYTWSFGDGTFSNAATPPPHTYPSPGTYQVMLKIKGQDGCERDSTKTITVAANPVAGLQVFDTCSGRQPRVNFSSNPSGVSYLWQLNGAGFNSNPPVLNGLAAGSYKLDVVGTSNFGCGQPATTSANFNVLPVPVVDALVKDGCAGEILSVNGVQTDGATTIRLWEWSTEGNRIFTGQTAQFWFDLPKTYSIKLCATAENGCLSDTVEKQIKIGKAFVSGRDTTVLQNIPSRLFVQTNGSVLWSPATGLSSTTVPDPFVTLGADEVYTVSAVTSEGCTAKQSLRIRVMKGPTVYVPSAFTPNGDGKNDLLLPVYVGIKTLEQFAVFNRWGGLLFSTTDMQKGWDGKSGPGTFVWLVRATNYMGQPVVLKGTVTVLY